MGQAGCAPPCVTQKPWTGGRKAYHAAALCMLCGLSVRRGICWQPQIMHTTGIARPYRRGCCVQWTKRTWDICKY